MPLTNPTLASPEDLGSELQALTIDVTAQWGEEVHQVSPPANTSPEEPSQANDPYTNLSTAFPLLPPSQTGSSTTSQTLESVPSDSDLELYTHDSDKPATETTSLLIAHDDDDTEALFEGSGQAPSLLNSFGQSIRQKLRFITRPVVPLTPRELKNKRGFRMFGERARGKSEQERERERDREGREIFRGRVLLEVD